MEQLLCGYTLGLWLHRTYQPQVGHSLNLRLQRREMLRTWLGKAENKFASFLFSILHLHPCPRLSSVPQCTPSQVPPQLMPGCQSPPGDLPEPVRGSPPPAPGVGTSRLERARSLPAPAGEWQPRGYRVRSGSRR